MDFSSTVKRWLLLFAMWLKENIFDHWGALCCFLSEGYSFIFSLWPSNSFFAPPVILFQNSGFMLEFVGLWSSFLIQCVLTLRFLFSVVPCCILPLCLSASPFATFYWSCGLLKKVKTVWQTSTVVSVVISFLFLPS